jgi:hypothetical protein
MTGCYTPVRITAAAAHSLIGERLPASQREPIRERQ